jgi:hypothetical protein
MHLSELHRTARAGPVLLGILVNRPTNFIRYSTMVNDHIDPLRLFDLAWTDALENDEETKHLRECEECQGTLEFFACHAKPQRVCNE